MGLNNKKIKLLREFVDFTCEECHKKEGDKRKDGKIVSILTPHRLDRGNKGGEYNIRNIKMVCVECHKAYHYSEFYG